MSAELVLELESVTKVYGEEPPVPALRGVSFSVHRGEFVAIQSDAGLFEFVAHIFERVDLPRAFRWSNRGITRGLGSTAAAACQGN